LLNYQTICGDEPVVVDRKVFKNTIADDPILIYLTSATTAMPKMVERDHAYALAHQITGRYWTDLREDDIHWTLTDTGLG